MAPSDKHLHLLRVAQTAIADGIIVVDAEGRCVFMNEAGRRLAQWEPLPGRPSEKQIGALGLRYEDGRPVPPAEAPLSRARRGETVTDLPLILAVPNAADISISATATPIRDEGGEIVGAVVVFRDITARLQAAEAVRQSEEKYRNLVELTSDIIYRSDREGHLTFLNEAGFRILETAPEECIGRPWSKWLPPEEQEAARRGFGEMIEKGKDAFNVEVRALSGSGRVLTLLHNLKVLRDAGGEVSEVQGIARDISERKRTEEALRESEERFRLVVQNSPDVVFYQDRDLRYTWIPNPEPPRTSEEVVGKTDFDLFPWEEAQRLTEIKRRVMETGVGTRVEMRLPFPEGEHWHETVYEPRRDRAGRIAGIAGYARDITERKRKEDAREGYVAAASHDLRNPLTTIIGMAGWLQHSLAKRGLEPEAHSLGMILTSAQRMNAMIGEMVEAVRLESGQLTTHKETVDLLQLVSEVVQRMGTLEDRARIQVEAPVWVPPLAVDVAHVERVIVNLVSNALKYSPRSSPVTVVVGKQGEEAVIAVSDKGAGIPAAERPLIFSRFHRTKTAKNRAEGLGLGLYISRLIVESLGGRIWLESEVGKGSTFNFTLPTAE